MEYKSNIQSVLLNIDNKLKKASDVSALQRTIATYLMASNLRRIHNNGLNVDGKMIGSYSVKPMYMNPKYSPKKFEPVGKNGRTYFKTNKADRRKFESAYGVRMSGKKHQTRYFRAGYFGFRALIGREIGFVNLQLSGKLKLDWGMIQEGKNYVIGFRSSYGTNVSEGNELHFGCQIWGISKKDYEEIKKIENEFIKKALA